MKRKTIKYNELKVGHVVEWHFDGSSGIAAIKEFVSNGSDDRAIIVLSSKHHIPKSAELYRIVSCEKYFVDKY